MEFHTHAAGWDRVGEKWDQGDSDATIFQDGKQNQNDPDG